ncbi:MAG: CPBP family intramembrane metalloprotease [Gemmataceae bacterium]|nr:CPBP family intramembrane metalloprotease [Gemmataceae bacterium]
MTPALLRVWNTWLAEPLRKVEADALAHRLSDDGRRIDWRTPVVLITCAVCLTVQNYTGHPTSVLAEAKFVWGLFGSPEAAGRIERTLHRWSGDQLSARVWWALNSALTYSLIPLLVLKFGFRARLADYGLKLSGVFNAWPLYVVFVLVMVPIVTICSTEERFQQTYPFMRLSSSEEVYSELWKWELAYAAQFVGLEFFFRGFLVHGTKHRFGVYAVFVMTFPYVMIHFGKPWPETCASIVAGVVLGFMSLATRSVWLGASLHIAVAWGMDVACLARRGLI